MPTERLYLSDPYLTRFTARVVATRTQGGQVAVELDRSAFYPEGGGQPGDRGTLGPARVLDVQDEAGAVLHLLDRPLPQGEELHAEVDWARRLDHMQQHHGQHLLSAAFLAELDAATVSFHLGERLCTIDLAMPAERLESQALRNVEARANASVWRNLPVHARDVTGEARAQLPLRKEAVKGDRVVWVEGVDASPCGGTHPARTGDVGAIAILGAEKWGKQSRVTFVCGGRVVRRLAEEHAQLGAIAGALRTNPLEAGELVERLLADAQRRKKQLEAQERELAGFIAAELQRVQATGPVVARLERSSGGVRAIAQALAAAGRVALIAGIDEGRAHLCFARPGGEGPDCAALLREALAAMNGKGGGSAQLAQGSGDPAALDGALERARGAIS